KRIGLKERPRRTPAARELSQRNSPYNLQVGAAELGGVIQKYGGNYILAFAGYPAERYQKATMSIRPCRGHAFAELGDNQVAAGGAPTTRPPRAPPKTRRRRSRGP